MLKGNDKIPDQFAQSDLGMTPLRPFGRRSSPRTEIDLPVNFFFMDGITRLGRVRNISSGGIWIDSDVQPDPGESISIYTELLGLVRGSVIRATSDGFATTLRPVACPRDPADVTLARIHEVNFKQCDDGGWVYRTKGSARAHAPQFSLMPTECEIVKIHPDKIVITTADDIGAECLVNVGNFAGLAKRISRKQYEVTSISKAA